MGLSPSLVKFMTYLQATQSDAVGPLHPPMQLTWQHTSPSHTPELQLVGQAEASMKVIKPLLPTLARTIS